MFFLQFFFLSLTLALSKVTIIKVYKDMAPNISWNSTAFVYL